MEELLLGTVFTGDELNIIHQKQVGVPVFAAEFHVSALFYGGNQLIGKLIAFDVDNMEVRMIFNNMVGNGVEQMGLAQSAFAVDEKRVIGIGRLGGNSPGSSMGKPVGGAHHEVIKGELLIDGIQIAFFLAPAVIFRQ